MVVNKIYRRDNPSGFTLLELIVVVGIFSMIALVVTQTFVTTLRSNTKTEVVKEVKQSGEFAMKAIRSMVQNALKITMTCDGTAVNETTVIGHDGKETILRCLDDAGVAKIASVSAQGTFFLTGDNSTLTNGEAATCADNPLTFTCQSSGGYPSSITISFRIRQKGAPESIFEKSSIPFQSTVVVRNR